MVGFGGYDGMKVVVVMMVAAWVATLHVRDDIIVTVLRAP